MEKEKAIIIGGTRLDKRGVVDFDETPWLDHSSCTGDVYCVDLNNFINGERIIEWKILPIQGDYQVLQRSNHCTVKMPSKNAVAIVGGLRYVSPRQQEVYPLNKIVQLGFDTNCTEGKLSTVEISNLEGIYLYMHACAIHPHNDNLLFVYGGYMSQSPNRVGESICPTMYAIDLKSKLCAFTVNPTEFATAGHSINFMDTTTVLVSGGVKKSHSIFTNKDLLVDKCDVLNCKLTAAHKSAVMWVGCDGTCNQWFHQVCLGLPKLPKKYYCRPCKQSAKK
jgi:hypothetical protein